MALRGQANRSLRLLLREQAERLARMSSHSALDSAQTPICVQYAASCLSAQLQQGHRLLDDSSSWSRDTSRGFHISLQGHQSAQAAAVQQQEDEDNEPEQTHSAIDPACTVRKAEVKQSKTVDDPLTVPLSVLSLQLWLWLLVRLDLTLKSLSSVHPKHLQALTSRPPQQ